MYVGATMAYQPYTECTTLGIRPNICMRGESEWERERDWSYKTLPVGWSVLRDMESEWPSFVKDVISLLRRKAPGSSLSCQAGWEKKLYLN